MKGIDINQDGCIMFQPLVALKESPRDTSTNEKLLLTRLIHAHPPDDGTLGSTQLHTHRQELGSGGGG